MNRLSFILILTCLFLQALFLSAAAQNPPARAPLSVFGYDSKQPLDIRYGPEIRTADYRRLDITYASPAGGQVPAFLYIPKGDGPFAGLVLLHGLPGSRHNSRWLGERYVSMGAIVLAITAPFARPEENPRSRPITLTETDRREQIQLMQDLQRGVDLLMERPNIDKERIGFSGGSYGAAMGGLFAGIERRIKAYSLWVGDGGLVAHVTGEDDRGGRFDRLSSEEQQAWLETMLPIEPIRFVGSAAPAELFFQSARHDRAIPVADAEAFIAAGSEPKQFKWYESGHGLNATAFRDQAEWMAQKLDLDFTKWRDR